MEQDFDLGATIRDELIPLALEYYLGVVNIEDDLDDEWSDEEENEIKIND